MAQHDSCPEAPSRTAMSLPDGFPTVYRRFRPFVWRGPVQNRRRINHLAVPPFLSPFKNGENGGNGAASNRRRVSTKIHPALTVGVAGRSLGPLRGDVGADASEKPHGIDYSL